MARALLNSDTKIIGKIGSPGFSDIVTQEKKLPVVLYPEGSAMSIKQFKRNIGNQRIQLVVLDGSWSQTRHMFQRYRSLYSLPKVCISSLQSKYLLRESPRDGQLCTIEAAAYALRELDGEEVANPLFALLDIIRESVFKCNPQKKLHLTEKFLKMNRINNHWS